MHIGFLLRLWPVYGGGETVTLALANELVKRGYRVSVLYFKETNREVMPFIDGRIQTFCIPNVRCGAYQDGVKDAEYVAEQLRQLVENKHIDILINQWWPVEFIKNIKIDTDVKLVKCLHIAVYTRRSIDGWSGKAICKRIFLPIWRRYEKNRSLKVVNDFLPYCDKYIFLSPLFLEQFKELSGFKDSANQLDYVYNPLPYSEFIETDKIQDKAKEVLFVGRLEEAHKKVSRILKSWAFIQKTGRYADWRLTIVGEGRDLNVYKKLTRKLRLKNVSFEGHQDPVPYYKRASLFVMTSEVEGFPMVLVESMQMGVVPVVMDSFLSLHDIIIDGQNGMIAPKGNIELFARKLILLMENRIMREQLACNGLASCREFRVDQIVDRWEKIFKELCGAYF